MIARNRGPIRLLVCFTLLTAAAPGFAQEPQPQYSPDGAWFATASMAGGVQVPFMDIYASDPTTQGRAGTVLCTLSTPAFQGTYGMTAATTAGHGNWVRIDKNRFAFTVWRILVDADPTNGVPDGAAVGTAKFWGTIIATGADSFEGSMKAQYYGPDGALLFELPEFQTAGKRVAIQAGDPN
jgi:hypothetical protein